MYTKYGTGPGISAGIYVYCSKTQGGADGRERGGTRIHIIYQPWSGTQAGYGTYSVGGTGMYGRYLVDYLDTSWAHARCHIHNTTSNAPRRGKVKPRGGQQ